METAMYVLNHALSRALSKQAGRSEALVVTLAWDVKQYDPEMTLVDFVRMLEQETMR